MNVVCTSNSFTTPHHTALIIWIAKTKWHGKIHALIKNSAHATLCSLRQMTKLKMAMTIPVIYERGL